MLCTTGKPKSPRIHGNPLEDRTNRIGMSASGTNLYLDASRVVLSNNSSNSTLGYAPLIRNGWGPLVLPNLNASADKTVHQKRQQQ
jgi:hypothetical protein